MSDLTTPEERALWRSFFVMRRQLELTLERRLQADAGISSADFEILVSLLEAPNHQLRAGQIGDDARGVWVVLTAEGSRAALSASRDHKDAVREYFFDVLSDQEKSALLTISTKVLDTINPPICDEITVDADVELASA